MIGYRYEDEENFLHMQELLFYKELDFPLQTIREGLTLPEHDAKMVLTE